MIHSRSSHKVKPKL